MSSATGSRRDYKALHAQVRETRRQAEQLLATAQQRHQQGDLAAADAYYAEALAADPRNVGALHYRGVLRLQQGKPDEAVPLIQQSLAIDPQQAQALSNLGTALMDLKRYDEAVAVLRKSVKFKASPESLGNLGRALRHRYLYDEAIDSYQRALRMAPERAGLWSALGLAQFQAHKFTEAVESQRKAVELAPDRADYRNNLAQALKAIDREAAAEEFREALALDPSQGEYHAGLGRILLTDGKYKEAVDSYRLARDGGARGRNIESAMQFFQNHVAEMDPVLQRVDAEIFANRIAKDIEPYRDFPNSRDPERRLRLGWVSADLRGHPVGRFMEAFLKHFDPDQFDMYAYSHIDNGDPINLSIKKSVPNWRMTEKKTDDELAKLIHDDQIDILVDLNGYTGGHRLTMFPRRPAPVAATWLGYFATTGFASIDYVICNRWLVPPEEEAHWTEKPWRLPSSHWSFSRPTHDAQVADTPALAGAPFTFGCYNNFEKISELTLGMWCDILRALPESHLLLRSGLQNPRIRQHLVDRFAADGFGEDRVEIIAKAIPYDEHLASYGKLDVALDPTPYNGGTTTVEALYMGVPVLTLHGDRFAAHMSESILRSSGLDEWVAGDTADYVRRAVAAAGDVPGLQALRMGMRQRMLNSILFDSAWFARDLMDGFRGMWRKWVAENPA